MVDFILIYIGRDIANYRCSQYLWLLFLYIVPRYACVDTVYLVYKSEIKIVKILQKNGTQMHCIYLHNINITRHRKICHHE